MGHYRPLFVYYCSYQTQIRQKELLTSAGFELWSWSNMFIYLEVCSRRQLVVSCMRVSTFSSSSWSWMLVALLLVFKDEKRPGRGSKFLLKHNTLNGEKIKRLTTNKVLYLKLWPPKSFWKKVVERELTRRQNKAAKAKYYSDRNTLLPTFFIPTDRQSGEWARPFQ